MLGRRRAGTNGVRIQFFGQGSGLDGVAAAFAKHALHGIVVIVGIVSSIRCACTGRLVPVLLQYSWVTVTITITILPLSLLRDTVAKPLVPPPFLAVEQRRICIIDELECVDYVYFTYVVVFLPNDATGRPRWSGRTRGAHTAHSIRSALTVVRLVARCAYPILSYPTNIQLLD